MINPSNHHTGFKKALDNIRCMIYSHSSQLKSLGLSQQLRPPFMDTNITARKSEQAAVVPTVASTQCCSVFTSAQLFSTPSRRYKPMYSNGMNCKRYNKYDLVNKISKTVFPPQQLSLIGYWSATLKPQSKKIQRELKPSTSQKQKYPYTLRVKLFTLCNEK